MIRPWFAKPFVTVMLSLVLLSCVSAQDQSLEKRAATIGLALVTDVPIAGSASRLDYQSIDESKRRLYIAHLGADMVTVFDIDSQKVVANLPDISRPHGILAVPVLGQVYVSATGTDQVAVVDENTLNVIARIPAGHYPDGIAFDPKERRVFVSDEVGRTVAVIDPDQQKLVKKIAMGGEVGNTHYDAGSGLIYSAVQSQDALVAIDPVNLEITARYKLPGCREPHGFLIDSASHCALITGEDNASYVVFDLTQKKIIAKGSVGDGPDVLAMDKEHHRIFVSSESGVVSEFRIGQGTIAKVGETFFAPHAHTVSVDQKTHRVFFPLQDIGGRPVLRIMQQLERKN